MLGGRRDRALAPRIGTGSNESDSESFPRLAPGLGGAPEVARSSSDGDAGVPLKPGG